MSYRTIVCIYMVNIKLDTGLLTQKYMKLNGADTTRIMSLHFEQISTFRFANRNTYGIYCKILNKKI